MDYLDPRKRRSHNIRLVIGYFLVAIVIGLGSYIIRLAAEGYGFNVKTGKVIQNALLFADSKPGGAEIYLNGQDKNATTAARLILPAGNYSLKLTKAGYRDWSRAFVLNEQSVARYVYPFLFPTKPVITNLKNYPTQPGLISESPDRHWLLVQSNEDSAQAPTFDEYDTTTLDNTTPSVQQISFPSDLLTNYSADSKLTEIEWSTDNANLLIEHTTPAGHEFIIFNRAHPDQSFNVDRMFSTHPDQVSLFNKKADQLYLFDQPTGSLQLGNTGSSTLGAVVLNHVLAYKPYGSTLITYVTAAGEPSGTVAAKIWDNGSSYKLNEFPAGNKYLIDAAQYQGNFYYIAGSDASTRISIYENPLDEINNPSFGKALPMVALAISGGQKVSFSDNTQFVEVESGQRFAVYDFQNQNIYQYSLGNSLLSNMSWMDGDRLIGTSAGQILVMDYDGTNKQLISPTAEPDGGLFNSNYDHVLAIAPASGSGFSLQDVDMRAGKDLPKNKQPLQG